MDLSECVHTSDQKWGINSILLSLVFHIYFFLYFVTLSVFKFSIPRENVEFHIHQSHKEIALTEVIKFYTRISKCELPLDSIKTEKIISVPILAKKYFWRFQLYYMLDIIPSCNLVQYHGNIMMIAWENGKNPNFGPILGPPKIFYEFYHYKYFGNFPSYHPMQFPGKLIDQAFKKWQKT